MKKIAILATAFTIAAGLAGCTGGDGDTKLDTASPDAGVAPTTTAAPKRRATPPGMGGPGAGSQQAPTGN